MGDFDMREALSHLSIAQVLQIASSALNRLSLREMGEVMHEAGVRSEIRFVERQDETGND